MNASTAPAPKASTPTHRKEEAGEAWTARFQEKLDHVRARPEIDLVFMGDSITHAWETLAEEIWNQRYLPRMALNLGISGDRTENLLWRLQNGEIHHITPKVAVIMIGTNNTGHRMDPAHETVDGIALVVEEIEKHWKNIKIVLLEVFPRGAAPDDAARIRTREINAGLRERFTGKENLRIIDLSHLFLSEDDTISPEIMPDYLHLTIEGYHRWAEALEPHLQELGIAPPPEH